VWSKTFERPKAEIFAIQDEIARSVALALEVTLGVGDLSGNPYMTRNVEAYEAFLDSEEFSIDPVRRQRSISALERAVRLDADFVSAWARLGGLYSQETSVRRLSPQEQASWLSKSATAFAEVERRAPEHPALVRQKMLLRMSEGMWTEAWRLHPQLETALGRVGGDWSSDLIHGQFLVAADKGREAVQVLEAARRRDPLNTAVSIFLGEAYANSGDLASAIAEQDRGLQIEGNRNCSGQRH